MALLKALHHAGRFSVTPKFSLFHVTSTGDYTLLLLTTDATEIVSRFKEACLSPDACGLLVRCNGMDVRDFTTV